jgi:hypothetical protein
MKKVITVAAATVVAALGPVLLAPSAWAMVAPPEPGGGASGSPSSTITGIAVWEVVAIALVAVVIGAVGTYFAQRTHRQSETRSVSMA